MNPQSHWERIYQTKKPEEVSWYRPHLEISLDLIDRAARSPNAHIIDIGGGESTLVDDLLDRGYRRLSVLDISHTALYATRRRLGARARSVEWLEGDVTRLALPEHEYDLWHDRAVFHFLTDPQDRAAYVGQVCKAVKPGGHVIVATFGPEGPLRCSGLDVVRYDAGALHEQFGKRFKLVAHREQIHRTPSGAQQQFVYCYCKLMPADRLRSSPVN